MLISSSSIRQIRHLSRYVKMSAIEIKRLSASCGYLRDRFVRAGVEILQVTILRPLRCSQACRALSGQSSMR